MVYDRVGINSQWGYKFKEHCLKMINIFLENNNNNLMTLDEIAINMTYPAMWKGVFPIELFISVPMHEFFG